MSRVISSAISARRNGGSDPHWSAILRSYPKYYASIRESTLRLPAMEKRIRASFYALKHLYPDAVSLTSTSSSVG